VNQILGLLYLRMALILFLAAAVAFA